jgi:ATP-binding cassette subfamily B protein
MLLLELPTALGSWGAGRRLEGRLRRAFLRKIPLLGDRYFQSRPVSDMAERAHVTHQLRSVPVLGAQLVRAVCELGFTAAALSWLSPASIPFAAALALAMATLPFVAQPAIAERELRSRNHAAALARFYLDALLGMAAIRSHGAEDAITREHDDRLAEWARAAWATLRAAFGAEVLQTLVGRSSASGSPRPSWSTSSPRAAAGPLVARARPCSSSTGRWPSRRWAGRSRSCSGSTR